MLKSDLRTNICAVMRNHYDTWTELDDTGEEYIVHEFDFKGCLDEMTETMSEILEKENGIKKYKELGQKLIKDGYRRGDICDVIGLKVGPIRSQTVFLNCDEFYY